MSTATVAAPAAVATEDTQDRTLLLVTLLLAGCGLTFVLSASQALAYVEHRWPLYYFARQLAGVAIGLVAMAVLMRIDYHRLRIFAPPAAIACGILMLLVLVPHLGVEANGARRWFSLGPLGTFQPSELGKLAFVLFLAAWFEKRAEKIGDLYEGLLPFALMLAAVLAVLMLEKDLGTALVTAAIFVSIYFAGGGRKRHLLALLVVLAAGFLVLTLLTPYRAARLAIFTDPFRDPLNAGFQSSQALIALGRGGLHGVGLGHSVQKFLWLPAAHTDFIFAIIGEETGLIGTTAVLAAYVVFAWRGYRAALRAPDRLGVMLAVGISTWIAVQALINMGTVTSTLPATGVPLPFISYGGTSVVILLAAVGVLLNVASHGRDDSFRRIDATLDSRRGDRGPFDARTRRRSSLPR
ncbi:MAG TPA: putative lipid II flippase FtsW [Candidatus Dormibacteraeota bacterium]